MQRIVEPARLQRLLAREDSVPDLGHSPLPALKVDLARLKHKLLVLPDDPGPAARSYRMLRAQLLRRIRGENRRAIGIVSAVDGEGKTLTAVNLALSIAADPNHSAVLLDLDLRRPSIAKLLELPIANGFESWLDGRVAFEQLCYSLAGVERLTIVPTVSPVAGSSEALAQNRTQKLLAAMKLDTSDRILIIDLPPVLLTDDFLTIAPLLDGVLLVAREGVTKREDLERVAELLGSTPLLGTVLNGSTESERRAY